MRQYHLAAGGESAALTPLVFSKLHRLLQHQLIGIHLGVKAVVGLQHDRQGPRADVDGAPGRDGLAGVDLGLDILQVAFPEALDGAALDMLSISSASTE